MGETTNNAVDKVEKGVTFKIRDEGWKNGCKRLIARRMSESGDRE